MKLFNGNFGYSLEFRGIILYNIDGGCPVIIFLYRAVYYTIVTFITERKAVFLWLAE